MRETMYELLSYEPFEEICGDEKKYVLSVLEGKKPPYDIQYKELFEGFCKNKNKSSLDWIKKWLEVYHNSDATKEKTYTIIKKGKEEQCKAKRTYPKLLKKICYYYMVNHDYNNAKILEVLGRKPKGHNQEKVDNDKTTKYKNDMVGGRNLINKWNLYIDYRRESEQHEHISLPIKRRGLKQEYLTQFIQKVYYEAHRQKVNEDRLRRLDFEQLYDENNEDLSVRKKQVLEQRAYKKDLPVFVDVFGGTASVAASMNVDSKHKVVNEFDKIALGTLFILIHFPEKFLERYQQFNIAILRGDYEKHIRDIFRKDCDIQDSDDGNKTTKTPNGRKGLWYYTDANIEDKIDEDYRNGWDNNTLEVVRKLRNAWFYCETVLVGLDESKTFHSVVYDEYWKHWWTVNYQYEDEVTGQEEEYIVYEDLLDPVKFPNMQSEFEKMLLGACYFIYYHSFNSATPSGEPSFRTVTVTSYKNMLLKYFDLEYQLKLDLQNYNLSKQYPQLQNNYLISLFSNGENEKLYLNSREKNLVSKYLLSVKYFIPNVSCLDEWRNCLKDAVIGTLSFEKLFIDSSAFYYLDSPYIFTSQYNAGFTDEQHKEMLDTLRGSEFKWLFSMQFNFPDVKYSKKDEKKRGNVNLIANYLTYLEGFLCELNLENGTNKYRSTYDKNEKYEGVYAIFVDGKNVFTVDIDEVDDDIDLTDEEKKKIKKFSTKEIFITNMDTKRVTPFNGMYVQLPLKKLIAYYNAHYVKLGGDIENDPVDITDKQKLRREEGRELLHEYIKNKDKNLYGVNFDTSYDDIVKFAKNEYAKELKP